MYIYILYIYIYVYIYIYDVYFLFVRNHTTFFRQDDRRRGDDRDGSLLGAADLQEIQFFLKRIGSVYNDQVFLSYDLKSSLT
jgi:hypothetical protein